MVRNFLSLKHRLLLVVCTLALTGCEEPTPPPVIKHVRAMELKKEKEVKKYAFPGRTRAVDRVNLSFRVEGPMIKRPVNVGDEVKKGELLARIDPRDFEVALQNARGKLEQTEANLRFAQRDYERATSIYKKDPGAISLSLLDQKEEEVNRLQGELKSLQAEVKRAQDRLDYTFLRSPYEGMVVATYVEPFEYVLARQPILRLLNATQVEMIIDVPENLITKVAGVDRIDVTFDAYPGRTFPAKVKEIGTEASATTRTYPVTLVIDQTKNGLLLAGMAGRAVLYGVKVPEFSETGFLLPPSALFTGAGVDQSYVWLVEEQRVQQQAVVLGQMTPTGIVVTQGLKVGDWVVTSGVNSLKEGEEVIVIPVEVNVHGEQQEVAGGREEHHSMGD